MSVRKPNKKGSKSARTLNRTTQFETFESRIVFSVDPLVADAGQDLILQAEAPEREIAAQVTLIEAHESTGAEYVFNDYGFDGSGQTVAVIDTGIAWDHYALGGGFGQDYRVVGGWDFAEGDANPFDDGGAGFHGSHVSGIIASDDGNHRGVASGVDLVGLRVFDDSGAGRIEWVEQALQWVHDNKDAFENPITTVNLSLGMDWNSNNVPGWATLEDEFAQLEADNIFISVAAGNAFKKYQDTGLAYPAVSDHVVPVASHGMDGDLSDFSQRNDRVLVAPGESIKSTVPAHMFGTAQSQSFMGLSGTSMAAPYVAGASAVLREAMGFMGHDQINQDVLYNQFRETANQFYDAVSGGIYHRLDLGAAIDAVIKDAHGAAADTATDLGTIHESLDFAGTIGKRTDIDAIAFTAGTSGKINLHLVETHQLNAVLKVNGQDVQFENGIASFDVLEGQRYTLSLSTDAGIGHYQVAMQLTEQISAIDLGKVVANLQSVGTVNGEAMFAVEATRAGYLTASVNYTNLRMEIYDRSMNLVSSASTNSGNQLRTDAIVSAGQRYFVKLIGNASTATLNLNNQVAFSNGYLNIIGTNGDDAIELNHGSDDAIELTVGGHDYHFAGDQVSGINLDGRGGSDSLNLELEAQNDRVSLWQGGTAVNNDSFVLNAHGFDKVAIEGDASDHVRMYDSAGNDTVTAVGNSIRMTSGQSTNEAIGFGSVQVFASSGFDSVQLTGSNGDDQFSISETQADWNGEYGFRSVLGFDHIQVEGGIGNDSLVIHGQRNANFELSGQQTTASLNGTQIVADGIENSTAIAYNDGTSATLRGTDGDDVASSDQWKTSMTGEGYANTVYFADNVVLDAANSGGHDTVVIEDSTGNDQVEANHFQAIIASGELTRAAYGFENTSIIASQGGSDHVVYTGSRGRDVMYSLGSSSWISSAGKQTGLIGFNSVSVIGNGGHDSVFLQGDRSNTNFRYDGNASQMEGTGYLVSATDFDINRMDGGAGQNTLHLSGFGADQSDRLTANGSALLAYLEGATIKADNFIWLEAEAEENTTASRELNAVDFWYALHGDWEDDA